MNLHIYLEDNLANKLILCAKEQNRKRNAIVREAIKSWLDRNNTKTWPDSILNFKGIAEFPDSKSLRQNLTDLDKDLF